MAGCNFAPLFCLGRSFVRVLEREKKKRKKEKRKKKKKGVPPPLPKFGTLSCCASLLVKDVHPEPFRLFCSLF